MNLLWVTDKYLDVSIDRITWIEPTKILSTKHRVTLVAPSTVSSKNDFGLNNRYIPFKVIPFNKLGHLILHCRLFFFTAYFLFIQKPDLILFHSSMCLTLLPLLLLKKIGFTDARFVLDVRTFPLGLSSRLVKTIYELSVHLSKYFCDGVTVITPFMRTSVSKQYHINPDRIGIWTSGVAVNHFHPGKIPTGEKHVLKTRLNIRNQFIILYHGVLSPDRGLQNCIQAMVDVTTKQQNILLILIGEGPAKNILCKMVVDLNLSKYVRIEGPISYEKMPLYVDLADVGILPFPKDLWWRVSSPIKLMEYLALSKPVIVTDIEAHRDVLSDRPFAFYIQSNRPVDIASGILQAYRRRKRFPSIGKQGRALVEKNHTWKAQVSRLETYLDTVVNK